ncbi:MAG: hypothetical protein QNL12_15660 [Acidimicrobiia bacterium]|nr:hypothetical protein [Acidimicrobiia bacterium]MDX2468750.1 hypothetical protein [Acidimicrobiia bacterium]
MVGTGRIDQANAQLVGELYLELRRFAAAVAPWDMNPENKTIHLVPIPRL